MGYTADTNDMLLEYNNFNQLTTVTKGNEIISYDYYPNGMRKSKTVDGVTTTHIWDGQNMAGEITGDNFTGYLRGARLIARQMGEDIQYYHFNGHGDTSSITDGNGTTLRNYTYDAFGNLGNLHDLDTNPFRYCGEYYDVETGFIYLRARYYDPSMGRFISQDTHWNIDNMIYGDKEYKDGKRKIPDIQAILQSGNLYAYCMNNPMNFIDPSGKFALTIAGVVISGEALALLGSGIMICAYLASDVFVDAFTEAMKLGKSIWDSITYAKGKAKDPTPPSKLIDGDRIKTPDSHKDEWTSNKDGSYTHNKTGWTARRAKGGGRHGGEHWDLSPGRGSGHINVGPDGNIY